MTAKVNPIPDGYRSVTPYLCVRGAAQALEFYARAFGAVMGLRMDAPDGRVAHAEFRIDDSMFMISDEYPEMGVRSPASLGGTPVSLHLYVTDVDTLFKRALAAGAKTLREVADQFYGDRGGKLEDPFGHTWHFATHIEDVEPEEMARRQKAMFG
jgi:PhnB protein